MLLKARLINQIIICSAISIGLSGCLTQQHMTTEEFNASLYSPSNKTIDDVIRGLSNKQVCQSANVGSKKHIQESQRRGLNCNTNNNQTATTSTAEVQAPASSTNSNTVEMICLGHDTSFGNLYTNLMITKRSDGSISGFSLDSEYIFSGTVKPPITGKNFLGQEVIRIDISDGTAISMFKDEFQPPDSDGWVKNTSSFLTPAGENYAIELDYCATTSN